MQTYQCNLKISFYSENSIHKNHPRLFAQGDLRHYDIYCLFLSIQCVVSAGLGP